MESTPTGIEDSLSLKEAAELFGVSVDTLRRRIRDDKLPEAQLVAGQYGDEYRLPRAAVGTVSDREGWAIDVAGDENAGQRPAHDPGLPVGIGIPAEILDRLLDAESLAAGSAADLRASESKVGALEAQLQQARNDLEHERVESQRLRADLSESSKAEAVAAARTEEIQARVADLERQVAQAAGERSGLQAALETAAASAAEAADFNVELSDQAAQLEARIGELEAQRDALAASKAQAEESLGWLGRRRFNKANKTS